jgi:hypothetical protein
MEAKHTIPIPTNPITSSAPFYMGLTSPFGNLKQTTLLPKEIMFPLFIAWLQLTFVNKEGKMCQL